MRLRRKGLAGLLVLCSLWALGSLRRDLLPGGMGETLPPLARQVVPLAMLAIAATGLTTWRKTPWLHGRQMRDAVLVGLGLFVVPSGLIELTAGWVSDLTKVALFALGLVLTVVLEPYVGRDANAGEAGGLTASLMAVAGVLLMFPVELPMSVQAGSAFAGVLLAVCCVTVANCRAVEAAMEVGEDRIAPFAAVAGGIGAAGIAILSAAMEHVRWSAAGWGAVLAWSAVVELPGLALLFWLMQRMSAARMMTRFVLAPLMAIVVEMAFVRPGVGLRVWLGLVLMACGAGWLLLGPGEEADGATLKLDG